MPEETVTIPLKHYKEMIDSIERSPCEFWACEGPYTVPKFMVTCHRCWCLNTIRKTNLYKEKIGEDYAY